MPDRLRGTSDCASISKIYFTDCRANERAVPVSKRHRIGELTSDNEREGSAEHKRTPGLALWMSDVGERVPAKILLAQLAAMRLASPLDQVGEVGMLKKWMLCAVAVAALLPAQSHAQEQAELIMFARGQYKGASYSVAGASQSMRVPFTVKSVQIPEGQAWELCSGNTFSGCKEFTKSDPSMVFNVRSVRPIAPKITTVSQSVGAVVTGPNPSLRGMASEFFVAPDDRGTRIEITAGTNEATTARARDFCRTRGWRYSVYARLQTIDGRNFLADVLCADAQQ
jgi:hypothetical protein